MEVMKQLRQRAIRDFVEQRPIRTQQELAAALRERGFRTTQATISRVGEGQPLGLPLHQRHPAGEARLGDPPARRGEHVGALVDAGHAAAEAARQPHGDRAGARGHVQHVLPRGHPEAPDEEVVPARLLAERQQRRPARVRRAREAGEEVLRLRLARRRERAQ